MVVKRARAMQISCDYNPPHHAATNLFDASRLPRHCLNKFAHPAAVMYSDVAGICSTRSQRRLYNFLKLLLQVQAHINKLQFTLVCCAQNTAKGE